MPTRPGAIDLSTPKCILSADPLRFAPFFFGAPYFWQETGPGLCWLGALHTEPMARLLLLVLATAFLADALPTRGEADIGTPLIPLRPANALANGCGRLAPACPLHGHPTTTSLPAHGAWILTRSPHNLAVKLAKAAEAGAGGTKGGTVIHDNGSVEQSWKGFVSLPGDKFQDRAGFHTVVSGDSSTVAVSSPMATGHGKQHTGKVQIYTRNVDNTLGVVWHQMGEDIYGDTAHEQSGYAIALNFRGDTVAIGSPYYNRTSDPHDDYEQSVPYVGQVRIFVWDPDLGSWNLLGKPIRGTQAAGRCGFSVHMGAMGRNLVLGCPRAKDFVHVRPNAGMVKVMKWLEAEEKWVAKGSPIYGNTTNIMAGIRVSMSGDSNTMAFIAPGMDDDDPSPGRVRVFNFDEGAEDADWTPMGEPIVNLDPNDLRGRCMYMSRDGLNVAIGSPTKEGGGHVRIYRWSEDEMQWVQRGNPVPGGGSYHSVGTSVAMNTEGNVVAVGSPFNSAKGKTAGRVRVYRWDVDRVKGGNPSPGWSLKGQELDGEEGDTNGFSVHLTGKGHMITIGAPQYKWKLDKDHLFFNAAVEPLHTDGYGHEDEEGEAGDEEEEEEDEDEDEEDEDVEDAAAPMLRANAHRKRVALSSKDDEPESSAGKPFQRPKNFGNGRARVLGAFHCEFLGDIVPPDNPY